MMKFFLLVLCFYCVNSTAEIVVKKIEHPKKVALVKIVNKISHEEEIEFDNLLKNLKNDGFQLKNNAIMFDTKGGNTHAAQSIGKIIRERRLNTFLAKDAECGSACIYALIGGVVRNVYGEVTVHRSSYNDTVPLEKIKKFTDLGDAEVYKYIYEMGISSQLATAILATPHWTRRLITKSELDAWSINGMDRMYEEFSARNLASETKTSVDDVHRYLGSMINNCEDQVRDFSLSQWECIRINYYWAMKKLRYDQIPPKSPTYLIDKFNYSKSQGLLSLD
jgi:hypothetical protein